MVENDVAKVTATLAGCPECGGILIAIHAGGTESNDFYCTHCELEWNKKFECVGASLIVSERLIKKYNLLPSGKMFRRERDLPAKLHRRRTK